MGGAPLLPLFLLLFLVIFCEKKLLIAFISICIGWVVGSLEILGSPASLVRSIGNGIADFFRLPYEGLTRGPGAFVSGVSRGTTSFVKHISKGNIGSLHILLLYYHRFLKEGQFSIFRWTHCIQICSSFLV